MSGPMVHIRVMRRGLALLVGFGLASVLGTGLRLKIKVSSGLDSVLAGSLDAFLPPRRQLGWAGIRVIIIY